MKGKVQISGAKNVGFKLMIASLLSDDTSTLTNIPYIRDVVSVTKIIQSLGAKVEVSSDTVRISNGLSNWEVSEELGLKSRASFMYLPVLLHRFKKGKTPVPGGDKLGDRPVNWFLEGLRGMGAKIKRERETIEVSISNKLKGVNYYFPKNTHTGTEALVMAATLAEGKTILENAATEPEVDDLISFLNDMGAKVRRVEKRKIEIEGVSSLKGATHRVMPDRNEVVTFACYALGTKGEVEIEGVKVSDVSSFLKEVEETGGILKTGENSLTVSYGSELKPTFVETKPHPGFMTDWQSLWVALMTQALGESIIHETTFENRFGYVENLKKMGAKIELFNPKVQNPEEVYNFKWDEDIEKLSHAVKVHGPTKLRGKTIEVADIRSGATLVFAALMAAGKSEISNIEHIERGYDDLEERLQRLGAKIQKIE